MKLASRLALIVCAASVAAILPAQVASAATPVGEYQLQGSLGSSGGVGPTLTNIGAGTNAFLADTVNGTSRQVLTFPQHNGLQMSPLGLTPTSDLSVVTTFRLNLVSSYRRILDLSNNTSDNGLYAHDGKADVYVFGDGPNNESTGAVLANNTYATVAYVTGGPAVHTNVYVNGALAVEYPGYLPLTGDTLRFFKDANAPSADEDSAGAVSCIRVFSGQLTDAEVSAIGTSPTCGYSAPATPATPAAPAAPKHKCKKKHKKRAAQSAKKKHCKKKHRR